jgi:hypothetical protein
VLAVFVRFVESPNEIIVVVIESVAVVILEPNMVEYWQIFAVSVLLFIVDALTVDALEIVLYG